MAANGRHALCSCLTVAAASLVLCTSHASEAPVAPVAMDATVLRGMGLQRVAPYRKEITLSGLQRLSASQLFEGAITIDVWETQDGGTLLLKDYPFDQYVHVLHGSTTLTPAGGRARSFAAGDSFVLPRGFRGIWTVSKGFREILIIESKSLKEGISQFE